MSEAEKTAKSLTPAQAALFLKEDSCVRHYKPGQKLIALGLWTDEGDEFDIKGVETPFGREVRAILESR